MANSKATSKELLLAILSMDSYNRGYSAGIGGLGSAGSLIGTATIKNVELPTGSQGAGFYAVAYETQYGTVISYRGTDNIVSLSNLNPWSDTPGSDAWNGYGTAIGNPISEQARLAAEFYQTVTGTTESDPSQGSAILTGHSLGGGLAGFVASIYGKEGYLYNNMTFELAATTAYAWAKSADYVIPRDPTSDAILADYYNGITASAAPKFDKLITYVTCP